MAVGAEEMRALPEFATLLFVALLLSAPWWYLRFRPHVANMSPGYPRLREAFGVCVVLGEGKGSYDADAVRASKA